MDFTVESAYRELAALRRPGQGVDAAREPLQRCSPAPVRHLVDADLAGLAARRQQGPIRAEREGEERPVAFLERAKQVVVFPVHRPGLLLVNRVVANEPLVSRYRHL